MTQPQKQIFSVSQLNRAAKDLLGTYLPMLWVEGEISNFSRPSSGHWYFTLKDERAQVRVAMFRNRNTAVRPAPANGDKVVIRAQVTLYENRGEFQLIAEHMEASGTGELQRRFEALKAQLGAEGLFDASRKKPLPSSIATVAVITSATGAAIHDILQVLKRRAPFIDIKVLAVPVQGPEAAPKIAQAIALANRYRVADVLIVGRGGGSLEDLWAFNEEVVARAVAASEIPIVAAVGHEVDFSICDFVADARAPTPSAAAELVSPDIQTLRSRNQLLEQRLARALLRAIAQARLRLSAAAKRLQHPSVRLQNFAQRLDRLEIALRRATLRQLESKRSRYRHAAARMLQQSPAKRVTQERQRLNHSEQRLRQAMARYFDQQRHRFARVAGLLQSVSPLATLERGYAIVLTPSGHAVRSATEVKVGDTLINRLHQGEVKVQVTATGPKS